MNIMKSILLVTIVLQMTTLLLILLLTDRINLKFFDTKETLSIKSIAIVAPVTLKKTVLTDKDEKSLIKSIKETKKELYSFVEEIDHLDFLYSKEAYQKMTQSVESYAKVFLGKPYVWGAIGPDKFDCSGFTKKIYSKSGIDIPRHSSHQAKVGKYVKYEDLERGDMVFFDTEHHATGKVNHVGIYLEDGKFIHASSGKKQVVVTNFNKKIFYKNRFLWGRRVIENRVLKMLPNFSKNSLEYVVNKLMS